MKHWALSLFLLSCVMAQPAIAHDELKHASWSCRDPGLVGSWKIYWNKGTAGAAQLYLGDEFELSPGRAPDTWNLRGKLKGDANIDAVLKGVCVDHTTYVIYGDPRDTCPNPSSACPGYLKNIKICRHTLTGAQMLEWCEDNHIDEQACFGEFQTHVGTGAISFSHRREPERECPNLPDGIAQEDERAENAKAPQDPGHSHGGGAN